MMRGAHNSRPSDGGEVAADHVGRIVHTEIDARKSDQQYKKSGGHPQSSLAPRGPIGLDDDFGQRQVKTIRDQRVAAGKTVRNGGWISEVGFGPRAMKD